MNEDQEIEQLIRQHFGDGHKHIQWGSYWLCPYDLMHYPAQPLPALDLGADVQPPVRPEGCNCLMVQPGGDGPWVVFAPAPGCPVHDPEETGEEPR